MEQIYPKRNETGTLGKPGKSWDKLYVNDMTIGDVDYTLPNADGAAGQVLKTDGSGTISWANDTGSATAFDDIADPDAAGTIAMTTFAQTITSTKTDGDMINIRGLGDFGDVSVVRIESITGNPTDGTVLEVVSHDANVDPLVVSTSGQAGVLVVSQDGSIDVTGDVDITGNLSVSGTYAIDALTASTADQTLTLNGNNTGGVNIGSTSTGGVTLGAAVTVADGKDVTIGEGVLTIDNDQTNESALVITSAGTTSGGAINIVAATTTGDVVSVTADDLGTGGSMIKLDSDNIATDNFYVECYNGSADEFTVSKYGATSISGNASTDMLTIVAGDVQLTAGDIDLDNGIITVDVTTDQTSYIKRNQGVTTGPVVEIEETAAAADNPALLIDQNATAATSYGLEIDSAGGTCINIVPEAVTGDGIVFNVPASYTGQLIKVEDTLVGTTGEGCAIDIKTTANLADGATLVRLDYDTGTMAGAHNGFMLSIDDDSVGVGTSYAVEINSNSNEALIVSAGKASFTEQIILTAGADCNAGLDIDMATNADLVNITNAAADLAAGAGITTVYGSNAAGQTNASYLMRLAWKADGDAQDHFLLCQDNSTGAAANGDEKFSISTGGLTKCLGGVSPGSATDSILMTDTVELSNADIKALRASPKELVATPGAGKFIELVSAVLILDYGSEVLTESSDNLVIQYGTSGDDITAAIEMTGFIDQAADTIMIVGPANPLAANAAADMVNNAITLFNTGDGEFGGNASNDTTMTVKVTYRIHATGL